MAVLAPIDPADVPAGMAGRIRLFDWSATPLGPRADWPERLRFAVDLCLRSPLPSALYWGPQRTMICNDAWVEAIGGEPPLGEAAAGLPASLWPLIAPLADEVCRTGQGAFLREQQAAGGEEGGDGSWWNCHLLPILAEDGTVAGILNQANEVTRTVLAERRISFQIAVADSLRGLSDPEAIKRSATRLLGEYLDAARVGYAEVDEAGNAAWVRSDWTRDSSVASLAGQRTDLGAFGEEALAFLRGGEVLALSDLRSVTVGKPGRAAAWEAIGMRALITVPLVRDGGLKALLFVHEPEPRSWSRSEAAMARDVAERTWAAVERARAAPRRTPRTAP